MTRILEAWLEGEHIGQFRRADDGTVTFAYAADAPATPISLSLPRDGGASKKAAKNFLENLLPDNEDVRISMRSAYDASSTATFDLLEKAGGDVAGGLVLLPEGQEMRPGRRDIAPALSRDIEDRIAAIKRDGAAWAPPRVENARFSLAGTQGKFALAELDGSWLWSNATVPSTHIVKPGRADLRGIEAAEAAALRLAERAGVRSSKSSVLRVGDETAFITERFDRVRGDGEEFASRLHAEDIAQSLGVPTKKKYAPSAKQVIDLLLKETGDSPVVEAFIRQLAFNTFIGNADAHAKNYSLILRPDGIQMAPLYDSVPVALYPEFSQKLAMRISGAQRPQAAQPAHWRKLAEQSGLDPDRVIELVTDVASGVAEHNDSAWDDLDDDQRSTLRRFISRSTDVVLAPSAGNAALISVPAGHPGPQPRVGRGRPDGGQFAERTNTKPSKGLTPDD